jgi:hypothetical protein
MTTTIIIIFFIIVIKSELWTNYFT